MLLNVGYSVTMTVIPYLIMIIYNIKISRYIEFCQHCLSPASRKVQTDLNRMLTTQAIIPVFTIFLPMGIYLLGVMTDLNLTFPSVISRILYSWIPASNAISALFFLTAYREQLKQLFIFRKSQLSHFISVSTIKVTNL